MTQCLHCNSLLVGLRSDAKYCSRKCANAFHYAADPEAGRARRMSYYWDNHASETEKGRARASDMIRRPEKYRDPNRPGYQRGRPSEDRVLYAIPRSPNYTHLDAAILIIENRLDEGDA